MLELSGMPKVYVVVLNWNRWADTLECIESLLRSDYPNFAILVCDNGSTDCSIERIKNWREGRLCVVPTSSVERLRGLVYPPANDLVVPQGRGDRNLRPQKGGEVSELVTLIEVGANKGYAGGNNSGIRHAISIGDASYVWILNNDTIVDSRAMSSLVLLMSKNPNIGLCGSRLMYFDEPNVCQAAGGGVYNKWFGGVRLVSDLSCKEDEGGAQLDFVSGASLMASKAYLQEVGVMAEEYFLYFEELDWASRGRDRFLLGYCSQSIVYHKDGITAGSSDSSKLRSDVSDFYGIRSRILFTRKFHPYALPTVYIGLLGAIAKRLYHGQYRRALTILKLMISPPSVGASDAPSNEVHLK
jgi:GT2 family glycosyltransferase